MAKAMPPASYTQPLVDVLRLLRRWNFRPVAYDCLRLPCIESLHSGRTRTVAKLCFDHRLSNDRSVSGLFISGSVERPSRRLFRLQLTLIILLGDFKFHLLAVIVSSRTDLTNGH